MIHLTYSSFIEILGSSGALCLSLFVLIGLALRIRDEGKAPMYLWSMLVFFGFATLDMVDSILFAGPFQAPLAMYGWQDILLPGFMISLYFFVRGLTSPTPKLRPADFIHLLPFGLSLLSLTPLLILPGQARNSPEEAGLSEQHLDLIIFGESAFWILWIIILLIYGGLSIRRLVRHQRNIRKLFSDLEGKDLFWLDLLVAVIVLLAGIVVLDEALILLGHDGIRGGYSELLFDNILVFAFGLFALRVKPPMPSWSQSIVDPGPENPKADRSSQTKPQAKQPYARSGLTEPDLKRFAKRLDAKMTEGQLWRKHALNLRGLASEVSIPSIHLSEVLNAHLDTNFYDYVNQYRIREACSLLVSTEQTILEISDLVGFNAKSTFNASFKKMTGQTPTEWRKRQGGRPIKI